MTDTLDSQIARFRDVRRKLETGVLALATSIDGQRFTFQASLHGLELRLGGYVVLEHDGATRLAQILDLGVDVREGTELGLGGGTGEEAFGVRTSVPIRHAVGAGVILEGDGTPLHDAVVRVAPQQMVRAWLDRTRSPNATLEIGELSLAPGVPCRLEASGFDRHTFFCGQSGSGKTYSLGVILEQLLLETSLRMVVLDPNSDFRRLGDVRPDVAPDAAARYRDATAGLAVRSAGGDGQRRLRLRIAELSPAAQAALLRIDPIADREEYTELADLLDTGVAPSVEALLASPRAGARKLGARARNLGLDRLGLWSGDEPGSVLDEVEDPRARGVVVDLGSLPTRQEQAIVAEAVLERLWQRRGAREPVLIVIDEAHNVCPAESDDPLIRLATEHAVRIAAEGRKFGLYLVVSTQRPQKVHENVLSQCDNVILMRLNSAADAARVEEAFGFVPPGLIGRTAVFGLGEALVAGKISRHPALIRFGARLAEEGGSDVPSTWAAAR